MSNGIYCGNKKNPEREFSGYKIKMDLENTL